MGYYRSGGGTVRFKNDADLDGAVLQHVKDTMFTDAALMKNASGGSTPKGDRPVVETYWYAWTDSKACRNATTLIEIIGQFFEEASFDGDDLKTLTIYDRNKIGQEDILFETLAPFIEPNTNIEWVGEDGAHWRWKFDGQAMVVQDGVISYED